MNIVTIRKGNQEHTLLLDFNRNIVDVLEKLNIELTQSEVISSLLYKQVVDPKLSFTDNQIINNEILEIKENYEL